MKLALLRLLWLVTFLTAFALALIYWPTEWLGGYAMRALNWLDRAKQRAKQRSAGRRFR